jgi:crotonobetaine/carnitine-CoA ligase
MTEHNLSVIALLSAAARDDADRVYAVFEGTPITFGALHQQSDAFAVALRRRGVGPGARVAVMQRNSAAALATIFGLGKAGAVWVPINARLRGDGLSFVLEHCDPRLVIADADLVATLRQSGARVPDAALVVAGGRASPNRLESMLEGPTGFNDPLPEPDVPFAISYTSGTTGRPKGVIVTHRMLRFAGEGAALASGVRDRDVLLMWEPLYHIGGSQLIVLPLTRRVTLAMVEGFSGTRFWQQARANGATHVHYLGGVLQVLLKQPPSALDRAHGVRVAWGGGCPPDVWRACLERFGVEIREAYGMTEASSITTFNASGTIGVVGRPVPWFSVDVRDTQGRPVAAGVRGEIIVRGREPGALFPGYFRDPDATAAALQNGELHTGDIGSFDAAGNLRFHGRMTDSIRCHGENVSAWEVEHVVATHPAVEECAMIGVAADIGEQDIKLFIKLRPGETLQADTLFAWLESRLASYQRPRYIAIVDDFERTPSHRVIKQRLSRGTDECWDRLAQPRGTAG